jgi:hypothetical protein
MGFRFIRWLEDRRADLVDWTSDPLGVRRVTDKVLEDARGEVQKLSTDVDEKAKVLVDYALAKVESDIVGAIDLIVRRTRLGMARTIRDALRIMVARVFLSLLAAGLILIWIFHTIRFLNLESVNVGHVLWVAITSISIVVYLTYGPLKVVMFSRPSGLWVSKMPVRLKFLLVLFLYTISVIALLLI